MEIEHNPQAEPVRARRRAPGWLTGLIPLLAIGAMLLLFNAVNPLALFRSNLPPVENLAVQRIKVVESGFEVSVLNSSPQPLTIAQVLVDDAFWQFEQTPPGPLPRLGRATLFIPYHWVEAEPHVIQVLTDTGLVFAGDVPVATLTPTPGPRQFAGYGLLGVYVGIIPVGLGLLWYPAMKRMGRKWLGFILALTVGLLVFLLIDTFLEIIDTSAGLPGVFQGLPLALFAALVTWLAIVALSGSQKKREGAKPRGLFLAGLIAVSIGLHNFGEGLAVGAAFALGEAALGSFLVIGFILHNITEGVGIAAPLVPGKKDAEPAPAPSLLTFAGLALLAGFPAVLGAWIGGFAFSPLLGTVFLGIGLGAIWQVIVEVSGLLKRQSERDGGAWITWLNLAGFLAGIGIMYVTAFLVKF
jgi:zinc transporter ZupT